MTDERRGSGAPRDEGRAGEQPAALAKRAAANVPRALVVQLATAVRFLTIVPVGGGTVPVGQSALFFPLVGLGLGGVLVVLDRVLGPVVPDGVRNVVLVAALAGATRGLHLEGLARAAGALRARATVHGTAAGVLGRDTASGATGGDTAPHATVRDRTPGALGAAALIVVLLFKLWSLDVLAPETRTAALLLAPMLARWSIVVLAFGSRPARREGRGFAMVTSLTFREFGLATVFALWVALASTAARGLLAILVLALVTIGCRVVAHRQLGGVTGDLLSGIAELNETLVLAVFGLGASPGVALARLVGAAAG